MVKREMGYSAIAGFTRIQAAIDTAKGRGRQKLDLSSGE
jgi:hypothetical protein